MVNWENLQHIIDGVVKESQLRLVVAWVRNSFPIDHLVFHSEHLPGATHYDPYLFLTYPKVWVDHYISENYVDIDPVVIQSARTVLPLNWNQLSKQGRRVKKLYGQAKEVGVGPSGVTIPVHSPRGVSSLVSYSSGLSSSEWALFLDSHLGALMTISHMIHEKIQALKTSTENDAPPMTPISHMEEGCLFLASNGFTMVEIAEKLGITERTVRAYLTSARHKLVALNTTHAVSKLFRNGIW